MIKFKLIHLQVKIKSLRTIDKELDVLTNGSTRAAPPTHTGPRPHMLPLAHHSLATCVCGNTLFIQAGLTHLCPCLV